MILWLTGQSGSGKTTIAQELGCVLGKAVILDGDEMRRTISSDLGFTPADREEHNLRVARVAKELEKDVTVIVALITPYESLRKKVQKVANPWFIHVNCPDEVCEKRDPKGIWKKARIAGWDMPFETPNPLRLLTEVDTVSHTVTGCIDNILINMPVGLYPGRFQPMHYGHLGDIKKILSECGFVTVGLRNTGVGAKDPFTIQERASIVASAVVGAGIDIGRVRIMTIPDVCSTWYKKLTNHLATDHGRPFDVVYAGNPVLKKPLKGKVDIKHLSRADNDYSATKIRRALKKGEGLEYFMPKDTAKLVKELYEEKA